MPGAFETIEEGLAASERRNHSRQPVRTLAYVELDEGNGGIVLNASEGGLSVQAVMSLMEDVLPKMRFQLSQSNDWFETSARVVWANESRKVAGLQFVDLPEETRLHIREWLTGGTAEAELGEHRERAAAYNRAHEQAGKQADPQLDAQTEGQTHSQPPNEELQPSVIARTPHTAAATPAPAVEPAEATPAPALHVLGQVGAVQTKTPPRVGGSLATISAERTWNVVGLVAVLAIVSLIAGWIAGRGTFDGLWQKSPKMASPSGPGQAVPPVSTGASAAISSIEIVDIHNQRWTVPFNPAASGYQPNYHGQAQSVQWPAFNPAAATPEIQSPAGRDDASSQEPSPPEVATSDSAASVPLPTQASEPRELVPPPAQAEPQTARPASSLRRGALIYHVDPVYPELAREQYVQGTVKLLVTIGQTGAVQSVVAVSGPGLLIEAARSAVRRWRYTPSLLDGKPVESQVYVSVVFQLPSTSK